jgi:hypothetical protein
VRAGLLSVGSLLLWLALAAAAGAESEHRPSPADARDAASLVARSELAAGRGEARERRGLKRELLRVQTLLHQALADERAGKDTGARSILSAECTRLRPRVARLASLPGPSPSDEWSRIGGALGELCGELDQMSAAASPAERRSRAETLFERLEAPEQPRRHVGPTIWLPPARPQAQP